LAIAVRDFALLGRVESALTTRDAVAVHAIPMVGGRWQSRVGPRTCGRHQGRACEGPGLSIRPGWLSHRRRTHRRRGTTRRRRPERPSFRRDDVE